MINKPMETIPNPITKFSMTGEYIGYRTPTSFQKNSFSLARNIKTKIREFGKKKPLLIMIKTKNVSLQKLMGEIFKFLRVGYYVRNTSN